jgi:hypothetical protein
MRNSARQKNSQRQKIELPFISDVRPKKKVMKLEGIYSTILISLQILATKPINNKYMMNSVDKIYSFKK